MNNVSRAGRLTILTAALIASGGGQLRAEKPLPPIPKMVTSFGAAAIGRDVYIYGGHMGGAHKYARSTQARTLYRLSLTDDGTWQPLGKGPPLQGLAMVAHGGMLYRIGGFTAKNQKGQEHDLWSQDGVSRYDPQSGKWTEMPPLPEPRSSFDAAVLGGQIYVVGGWQLRGDQEARWHQTAYRLDPSLEQPAWQPLPEPPFQRRALSAAAHQGKLYAVGGMTKAGQTTTRVDVYDPQARRWAEGPSLIGKPMDGFGSSAFAVGGRLYVSTYAGNLQRLSRDRSAWKVVRELERDRFFHRMLPVGDDRLLLIGGASMTSGKFAELDLIRVE